MQDIKNLFQPKQKDEKEIIEAVRMIDLTANQARACLDQKDFKLFRESYERTERATVDAMINFTKLFVEGTGEITRYALVMSRLATKLETLRYLLKTVENNAKRGIENDKDLKNA